MTLYDAAGRPLQLGDRLGSGGEGEVHRLRDRPEKAAKIFHARRLTPELGGKLQVMRDRRPQDPNWSTRRHRSFAWVEELVYCDPRRGACAGYVMPAIDLDLFRQSHCVYDTPDRIRRFGGEFTWRHLLAAAFNLAASMAALHAEGHRVGDVRETNVLVGPNALVTLVDCDSFEVHGDGGRVFPTRVGTAEYLPPELQGADLATAGDRLHADRFGLAVLLFQFLMLGAHPFQAVGRAVDQAPSTDAKIRLGLFPHGSGRRDLQAPDYSPPWEILAPRLRALFRRAFVDGHERPERRPAAEEWVTALNAAGAELRSCRRNPFHRFGAHLRSCPWCRLSRHGRDPFPAVPRLGAQKQEPAARPAAGAAERRAWLQSHAELALADGALTPMEQAFLRSLGSQLGVAAPEVAAVVAAAERQPARQVKVAAGRPSPRSYAALLPWLLIAAVLGFEWPVAAPVLVALVVLPLLAIAGEAQARLAAGEHRGLLVAGAIPRALQIVLRSIEHEVPALLTAAALAVVAVQVRRPLAANAAGAAATLAIAGWAAWSALAAPEDPYFAAVRRSTRALTGAAAGISARRGGQRDSGHHR